MSTSKQFVHPIGMRVNEQGMVRVYLRGTGEDDAFYQLAEPHLSEFRQLFNDEGVYTEGITWVAGSNKDEGVTLLAAWDYLQEHASPCRIQDQAEYYYPSTNKW